MERGLPEFRQGKTANKISLPKSSLSGPTSGSGGGVTQQKLVQSLNIKNSG